MKLSRNISIPNRTFSMIGFLSIISFNHQQKNKALNDLNLKERVSTLCVDSSKVVVVANYCRCSPNHPFPFPLILRSATVLFISSRSDPANLMDAKFPKTGINQFIQKFQRSYHGRLLRISNNPFTFQCLEVT